MARIFIPVPSGQQSGTQSFPNKIITRGMGATRGGVPGRQGLVVQGYTGTVPGFIPTTLLRQINLGQSGYKRRLAELDEIIIWAKLIEMNNKPPPVTVKGWIRVKQAPGRGFVSVMAESVRVVRDYIKVTVSRLK